MRQVTRFAIALCALALPHARLHAQDAKDAAPAAPASADVREVRDYKLTLTKIDQFTTAAAALKRIATSDPAARIEINSGEKRSIDDIVAKLDANWKVKQAITDAKLTTREFVVIQAALLSAMMANAAQQSIGRLPDVASSANIEFVKTNMVAIQEKLKVLASP